MSTRLTYRNRHRALTILAEIAATQSNARRVSSWHPILAFADLCFNIAGPESQPDEQPVSSKSRAVLAEILAQSTKNRVASKPAWAAQAEAVLHLCERMLGILPAGDDGANPRLVGFPRDGRSVPCGTYSTPDFVADQVTRQVLKSLGAMRRSRVDIADLSLEAGHFALSTLGQTPSTQVNFFGVDRDPLAIQVAGRILQFARQRADCPRFTFQAQRFDSILDPLPDTWPRRFDAIIGNPPWKTCHPTDAPMYRQRFAPYLRGRFDVYLAFMLQAHAYLKPHGLLSFVLPSQFLFNQNAVDVRDFLLTEFDILRLDVYPRRSFVELSIVAPVSFLARKRSGSVSKRMRTTVAYHPGPVGHGERQHSGNRVAAAVWDRLPGKIFHPMACTATSFLAKMTRDGVLKDFGEIACGARLGATNPTNTPRAFTGYSARHLRAFHACPRHAIRYGPEHRVFARTPPLEYQEAPKVLFQDIRCVTAATRLVAARGDPGSLAVSTASMFVPFSGSDVSFFVAILNSQLANAWYKLRDVNRSIRLGILAELPVVHDERRWKRIAEIGDEIARLRSFRHRFLASCIGVEDGLPDPSRFPKTTIRATELWERLDKEVFQLYRLSSAQVTAARGLAAARVF